MGVEHPSMKEILLTSFTLLLFGLGIAATVQLYNGWRSGVMPLRHGSANRKQRPLLYWFAVGAQIGGVMVIFSVAVYLLTLIFQPQ